MDRLDVVTDGERLWIVSEVSDKHVEFVSGAEIRTVKKANFALFFTSVARAREIDLARCFVRRAERGVLEARTHDEWFAEHRILAEAWQRFESLIPRDPAPPALPLACRRFG